jgi:hypothetical protein
MSQLLIKDITKSPLYIKAPVQIELLKSEKNEDGLFRRTFIMSTEIKDRDGDLVKLSSGRIDRYNANPIIAWQHKTYEANPDFIIGYGHAFYQDGKLLNTITFEPQEINPLAAKLTQKMEFGSLRAGSMGFIGLEGSYGSKSAKEDPDTFYIREWELLEFSVVTIPAHPEALVIASAENAPQMQKIHNNNLDYRTATALLTL